MPQVLTLLKSHKYLFFGLIFYIVLILFIGVKGNYPTNDDWYFLRQVESFRLGEIYLNAKILPIFLSQGFLGLLWSYLFGLSFESFRYLSLVIHLLSLIFLYKLFLIMKLPKPIASFGTLIYSLNPIIFSSSFTFMTETYFMFFIILSMYYAYKYSEERSLKSVVLMTFFMSLASLCRQTGLVLFFAFALTQIVIKPKLKKQEYYVILTGFIISCLLVFLWPRYQTDVIDTTIILGDGLFTLLKRVLSLSLIIPSLLFWLSPLLLLKPNLSKKFLWLLPVSILLLFLIYKVDIFPLGNVFYLEGLHLKTGYRHNFSVFDNVLVKLLVSVYLVGIFTALLSKVSLQKIKSHFETKLNLFLYLCILGFLATYVLTPTLYDRYFLPVFLFLLVIIIKEFKRLHYIQAVGFFILFVVSFFNTYEYVKTRSLLYKIYEQLVQSLPATYTPDDIYIDDTFLKYYKTKQSGDFKGMSMNLLPGEKYYCFIQQYTRDTPYSKFLAKIDKKFEVYLGNPSVYNGKPAIRNIRITKHLTELNNNEMYFSPVYSIMGKKAFVGSWCEKVN